MSAEPGRPAGIASLLASAFLIDLACSFAYYGFLKGLEPRTGWPLFLVGWALAILLPVFAYLTVKRGGAKAAFGPFMLFLTPGLLLGMVFPFALL
jgi:hypothetical protein